MKNDEKTLNYVEYRLQQWADWYTRGNLYGIGYPSTSTEYRLMTEGNIVRNPGAMLAPTHDGAEEMEMLVKKMAEQNRLMALVIRCHYFHPDSFRTNSNYLKKMGVEISYNHFKHYVEMAKQWLIGYLSSKQNKFF